MHDLATACHWLPLTSLSFFILQSESHHGQNLRKTTPMSAVWLWCGGATWYKGYLNSSAKFRLAGGFMFSTVRSSISLSVRRSNSTGRSVLLPSCLKPPRAVLFEPSKWRFRVALGTPLCFRCGDQTSTGLHGIADNILSAVYWPRFPFGSRSPRVVIYHRKTKMKQHYPVIKFSTLVLRPRLSVRPFVRYQISEDDILKMNASISMQIGTIVRGMKRSTSWSQEIKVQGHESPTLDFEVGYGGGVIFDAVRSIVSVCHWTLPIIIWDWTVYMLTCTGVSSQLVWFRRVSWWSGVHRGEGRTRSANRVTAAWQGRSHSPRTPTGPYHHQSQSGGRLTLPPPPPHTHSLPDTVLLQ